MIEGDYCLKNRNNTMKNMFLEIIKNANKIQLITFIYNNTVKTAMV